MQEVWKDIKNYEGLYQVSNIGRVKSLSRQMYNGKVFFTSTERILKQNISKGYCRVCLCKDNRPVPFLVHRLVAYAFVERSLCQSEVNHKDGNKSNNKVANLEWCTSKENQRHALETGLMRNQKGSGNFNSKLDEEKVRHILLLLTTDIKQNKIAKMFGVSEMLITRIKQREIWKHVSV